MSRLERYTFALSTELTLSEPCDFECSSSPAIEINEIVFFLSNVPTSNFVKIKKVKIGSKTYDLNQDASDYGMHQNRPTHESPFHGKTIRQGELVTLSGWYSGLATEPYSKWKYLLAFSIGGKCNID